MRTESVEKELRNTKRTLNIIGTILVAGSVLVFCSRNIIERSNRTYTISHLSLDYFNNDSLPDLIYNETTKTRDGTIYRKEIYLQTDDGTFSPYKILSSTQQDYLEFLYNKEKESYQK